jgi:hypothetical protein
LYTITIKNSIKTQKKYLYLLKQNPKLKTLIAILLLTVFAFNNMGYYIVFKILQMQVRSKIEQQIKEDMPDAKLHLIRISKKDKERPEWSWLESDKEFSYKGMMYDVVKIKIDPDSVNYYCISDNEESGLSDRLDKLVQDNITHSKKTNQLEKLNSKLLFIQYHASFTTKKSVSEKGTINLMVKEAFQSAALDIPVPPPQLV